MKKLAEMAREALTACPLMVGRTALKTQDVLNKDLTVICIDFAPKVDKATKHPVVLESGEVATYPVVVFQEYPSNFYGAGLLFDKAARMWLAAYGTIEELNKALEAEGGVSVRFYSIVGKNYTGVEFL